MTEFVYKKPEHEHGFGNLLINLSRMAYDGKCTKLHDNVYGYELSNCITISGFTRVSHEGTQPDCPILINYRSVNYVYPNIRAIIQPTEHMKNLIKQNLHLLDGVCAAVCIRRGSCAEDSVQYKGTLGDREYQYFCSEKGLAHFERIIEQAPGRIYVASDSAMTKKKLKEKFGNKVTMNDTVFTFTGTQDQVENQTVKNLQDVYLVWFLISMCPQVFTTGGNPENLIGASTYGITAAIYGDKPRMEVFNI